MQHNYLLILGREAGILHNYLIEYNLTFPTGKAKQTTVTTGEIKCNIFRIIRKRRVTHFIVPPDQHNIQRELLDKFLQSATSVLSTNGEIHVALCGGQGGVSATTLQEWKGSWTASLYGGEHGLLLANTFPFEAQYHLSSHRGVDRSFKLGNDPMMHIFLKPDGLIASPTNIQLCCRHELHVIVPDDNGVSDVCFIDQICAGDGVENIIQSIVPEGVRVEVPARKILDYHETHEDNRIAVFLVVYCSEKHPITRSMADEWRTKAELEVGKVIPLRQNRAGRTVSHPFPYTALHPEIKYNTKLC